MRAISIVFLFLFVGALQPPLRAEKSAFKKIEADVHERSGRAVRWEQDEADQTANQTDVNRLLSRSLTVNSAVQIALLNNRDLQVTFDEIGLSSADVREAATLPNPEVNFQARFPDKSPSGTDIEYSLAYDFLSALMIPLKTSVAKEKLRAVSLRVTDETLHLIAEVESSFYGVQASQQLVERVQQIDAVNAASLLLAQRQHEAGNISELDLARQQDSYDQARLTLSAAEADFRENREKLNRLLSLWGQQTGWKLSGHLPDLPPEDPDLKGLESLAIRQRLDLAADYAELASWVKALGLEKTFRWGGILQFGVDSERNPDSSTVTGPTLRFELPLFNQGQAHIERSAAALRQAEHRLESKAIDIRSEVRELHDRLVSKREQAQFYRDELLPIRAQELSKSQLFYNAMILGAFELLTVRRQQLEAEHSYIETLRDYWVTRAQLERAVGGNLSPHEEVSEKQVITPISSQRGTNRKNRRSQ